MKVTCEYCDSLVEVASNMRCPVCGGDISEPAKAAQALEAERAAAESQAAAEAAETEARRETIGDIARGVASVAGAFALGSSRMGRTGHRPPDGPRPDHGDRMPMGGRPDGRPDHRHDGRDGGPSRMGR